MKKTVLVALGVFCLNACDSQSQASGPTATDHFVINYTDIGTPESCKVEILSTISAASEMYMLEYDLYLNGQKKMFSQLQFSGNTSIDYVRDRTVSLLYEDAPCNTYEIEWRNLECITTNRDKVECPEVVFEGDDLFKSVSVDRS